jgi:transposase
MRLFRDLPTVYLHRDVVDFRKSIDGLAAIAEQQMDLDPFGDALYVFCNRHRDGLKVLYWDQTGFCLWYKNIKQCLSRNLPPESPESRAALPVWSGCRSDWSKRRCF